MNYKALSRIIVAASSLVAGLLLAQPAEANPSGISKNLMMTPISTFTIYIYANLPYTFQTHDLQPLQPGGIADTVLHVQNEDGTYLGGNDDIDLNTYASEVDLTVPTDRWVNVIVRAYSENTAGTGTLTVWQSGASYFVRPITFAGKQLQMYSGLVNATEIRTVEQFNGPEDSVLLVIAGTAAHAIAYDDDGGVGLQSYIRLPQACESSYCLIIYGRYTTSSPGEHDGYGTVVWDGDVNNSLDADHDGLGNTLEGVLHTSPSDHDTDHDGLDDAAEVYGFEQNGVPVKLPTWGANPTQRDMFVEVDWNPCPGCVDPDQLKMDPTHAALAVSYFAPDISVHLDIGTANPATTLAEWSKWGNWGGAHQAPFDSGNFCAALSSWRIGAFHLFHITSAGDGGQTRGQPCSYGGNGNRTVAHELGHQVGLAHEGNAGTGHMNSKPNYRSMMNYGYAYDYAVSFSRGGQPSINPTALNESASPFSSQVLTTLAGDRWRFTTDPANGKIDWNRDGRYDSNIRGAPTWAVATDPYTIEAWMDIIADGTSSVAMARMSSPSRFYLFSRRSSDGLIQYRYSSGFSACSGGDGLVPCVTWSQSSPVVINNSKGGSIKPPAAYRVTVGGQEQMMLVYTDGGNGASKIWYQRGNSADVWSPPKVVVSTTNDSTDIVEPTLAPMGASGKLRIFFQDAAAGSTPVLRSRDYDPTTDTWSTATNELTSSGATIPAKYGVSVTKGYEVGISSASWYMALVDPTNASQVQIWRYSTSTSRWTQLTAMWAVGAPVSDVAPALAYVPFSSSDQTKGQFYLVYRDPSGAHEPYFMKTEGNDPGSSATSRRLQWRTASIPFYNGWTKITGRVALLCELGVDTNLHGAYSQEDNTLIYFAPIADGIANIVLRDQNDYPYMTGLLSCALGAGGCNPLFVANDSLLSYSSTLTWSSASTDGTYVDSDAHFSRTTGDSASYTFLGTAVQVLGDRATNHGFGDVAIDGLYEGRFDAYSSYATGGSRVLWQKDGLASGSHTIKVSVAGAHDSAANDNYITVDAIQYWASGGLPFLTNQANDGAAYYYGGSWISGAVDGTFVGGDAHWSRSATASWSFSFYGGGVQILSDRHPNHGYADVAIDGIYRGRYDGYYNYGTGGKQVVWEISGLTVGSHTVQVTVVGSHNASATDSYVVLDAVNYQ